MVWRAGQLSPTTGGPWTVDILIDGKEQIARFNSADIANKFSKLEHFGNPKYLKKCVLQNFSLSYGQQSVSEAISGMVAR